jgi:hypothetical protein
LQSCQFEYEPQPVQESAHPEVERRAIGCARAELVKNQGNDTGDYDQFPYDEAESIVAHYAGSHSNRHAAILHKNLARCEDGAQTPATGLAGRPGYSLRNLGFRE